MSDHPTIFIVDDDAAVRKGLCLSLRERGYEVQAFESASDFLAAPNTDTHGCLLLDNRMPDITGLELQKRLLKIGHRLPIIFLTGHGDVPTAVRAMRKGAVDFLEKPYTLPSLLRCINLALRKDQESRSSDKQLGTIRSNFKRLTERELEVMTFIVSGKAHMTNRVIAEQLGIGHRTVETYRVRLMEKMQARSIPDLVQMAQVCGLIDHENTLQNST